MTHLLSRKLFWAALVVLLLVGGRPAFAALTLLTTFNTPGGPSMIAVNPVTNRIYVSTVNDQRLLYVIDGATNTVVASISFQAIFGSQFPNRIVGQSALAVDSNTNRVYVALSIDRVAVLDGATNAVIGAIALPQFFGAMAVEVNPYINRVYVAGQNGLVSTFDGATLAQVGQPVSLGANLFITGLAIDPLRNKLYASNNQNGRIDVLAAHPSFTGWNDSFMVPESPLAMAVNPVTHVLSVTQFSTTKLLMIDGLSPYAVIGSVEVAATPRWLAVNPNNNLIYLSNLGSNLFYVIDGVTKAVVKSISYPEPAAIAVNTANNRVYMTDWTRNFVNVFTESQTTPTSTTPVTPPADPVAGPQGPQGPAGPQGATGDTGPQGAKGDKGDTGATGPKGDTGDAGVAGAKGETGDAGAAGAKGDKGDKGDTGLSGAQGPAGADGGTGPQGPKGDKGETGATGPSGATGPAGPSGASGAQGLTGPAGLAGPAGPTGAAGLIGPAGPIGKGLDFEIRRASDDTEIAMGGAGNASVVYLVDASRRDQVTMTLPAATTAKWRLLTITRVGAGRKITIRVRTGELLNGATTPIVLDERFESITLATDGVEWVVVSKG